MNGLSWFLYLAEVLPNVSTLLGIAGASSIVIFIFVAGLRYMVIHDQTRSTNESKEGATKFLKLTCYKIVPMFLGLVLVSVLIPSKETIYLIAGSEASEYVVTSEYGQEILGDIKTIIKTQLENMKESEE